MEASPGKTYFCLAAHSRVSLACFFRESLSSVMWKLNIHCYKKYISLASHLSSSFINKHTAQGVHTWLLAIMYGPAVPMRGHRFRKREPKLWQIQILASP